MNQQMKKGFTLIEIMLVIVIIGIIVGIAVPQISGKLGKSVDTAALASLKAVESAIHSYQMDHLRLPDSLNDLTTQKDGKGPYLTPSKIVDQWKNPYVYSKPGAHGLGFDLSCKNPETGKEFNNWE
ncbi:MAG: prepilin-type N-terminal cleavage/methylation domain-containing protein [Kiritimatiellaceae bacterium]|nr:prepilin-type N-terminal cleavage/methylation domain-containing protein [Kiritimatiellaceae bacterium]